MKKTVLIGAVALAAFQMSPVVAMDDGGEKAAGSYEHKGKNADHKGMQRRGGGGHSKQAFMESYDLNSDGHVSVEEFYEARDKGYTARDGNGDGAVKADEYVAEYEVRLDKELAERRDRQLKQAYVRFGVLDGDKDGVMTLEEFKTSGKRMFDRLDTNKDGVIDEKDDAERY